MDFEVQFFFMYMALTDGASVVPHRGQQKRQSGSMQGPFCVHWFCPIRKLNFSLQVT